MRVLQVIHGYPPRYNAGSEKYTRAISLGLAGAGHKVSVFTREEDPFRSDYAIRRETDPSDPSIEIHLVNMPRSRDRYRHDEVDARFVEVARALAPDVVHVGHLNHLSTSIVSVAKRLGLPVVFTLHDYWLMCPRGQFLQHALGGLEPWPLCDGQDDRKCAERCYARNFGGGPDGCADRANWEGWVHRRMDETHRVAGEVDAFVAPSTTILRMFRDGFGVPEDKLIHLDYGFRLSSLTGRRRRPEGSFVFGYIGTHRPAKGVYLLLDAFANVRGAPRLRIWGRTAADTTPALKERASLLPADVAGRIEWMGEYGSDTMVPEVFDRVDAIVVPSIWLENSPLVIHEAQQTRVPVVTADLGGMAEYVKHEVNGLLFRPRDSFSLAEQMQRLVDDPGLGARLGGRGYLYSSDGNIPSVEEHIARLLALYARVIGRRG